MQNVEIREPLPIFVVVVPQVLIGRDIEMMIRDLRPDARVILAFSLPEAAAALPVGRIDTLFVQMNADIVAASDLGKRVEADGGKTVLVGVDADVAVPHGWSALPFPFANDHLTSLLACAA